MAKKASTNTFGFDPANFFGAFDPAKIMGEFDPAKTFGEFNKFWTDAKFPGMEIPGMTVAPFLDSQRKTFEAAGNANRVLFEGMKALADRQTAIVKEAAEAAAAAVEELAKAKTPQDAVAKQADMAKDAYTKVLENFEEISGMYVKTSAEASSVINARFVQTLDELRDEVLKLKH